MSAKVGCLILITLMLAVMICSCSVERNEDGIKYLIGVSYSNLAEPWQIEMNNEIKSEASKYEYVKVVSFDAAGNDLKQQKDIDTMRKQKVDILIASPNNTKTITNTVSEVFKSGIPVILMGYPIENDNYTMLIRTDNKKIGRYAGEYIKKLLGERGGTVLEIQGNPDAPVSKERKEGLWEVLKDSKNIKKEYVIVGYWLRDKTIARLKESAIFERKPKVDVIFAQDDSMAIGASRVAAEKGLKINIIGVGGIPGKNGGLEAIEKGVIDATFLYPTGGKEAVSFALKIMNGEKVEKNLELSTKKITKENVKEYANRIQGAQLCLKPGE